MQEPWIIQLCPENVQCMQLFIHQSYSRSCWRQLVYHTWPYLKKWSPRTSPCRCRDLVSYAYDWMDCRESYLARHHSRHEQLQKLGQLQHRVWPSSKLNRRYHVRIVQVASSLLLPKHSHFWVLEYGTQTICSRLSWSLRASQTWNLHHRTTARKSCAPRHPADPTALSGEPSRCECWPLKWSCQPCGWRHFQLQLLPQAKQLSPQLKLRGTKECPEVF